MGSIEFGSQVFSQSGSQPATNETASKQSQQKVEKPAEQKPKQEKKKKEKKPSVKFEDQPRNTDVTVLVVPPLALSNGLFDRIQKRYAI